MLKVINLKNMYKQAFTLKFSLICKDLSYVIYIYKMYILSEIPWATGIAIGQLYNAVIF